MKGKTRITIIMALLAIILFFVMLQSGRETLLRRQQPSQPVSFTTEEEKEAKEETGIQSVDDEGMDPKIAMSLKYERYPLSYVYFVTGEQPVPIYSSPNADKHVLRMTEAGEKLNYLEKVEVKPAEGAMTDGGVEVWYHIYWYEDRGGHLTADGSVSDVEKKFGFIREGTAQKRRFELERMAKTIERVQSLVSQGGISHVVNYKNGNGKPPAYKGKDKDAQGNRRSQSAPGYPDLTNPEEFTYLSDGTMVKVLESYVEGSAEASGKKEAYRKVLSLFDEKEYYVPIKYIPVENTLNSLEKVIVIDRNNQNEAAFEKNSEGWKCVSYTIATTGTMNAYAVPTPLGYYMVMEKRPQFYYYKDGTTQLQGYAPYTLRFCGGAYIHGVPVSYQYKNGERITPPQKEYSSTLGTVPLSHKCVRNITSHAKFLYDWYEQGRTIVIVME